jgi:RNA polymerase sigma-70 factor, ECF subfamily
MSGGTLGAKAELKSVPLDADNPKMTREEWLIELYEQLRAPLLAYLGGLGLTFHEAEDVIHESFLRLFDRLSSKGEHENPRAWLFRVAHNLSMDLFRAGRRFERVDCVGDDPLEALLANCEGPEESVIRNEQARRMHSALGRLTKQQRAAVLLRAEDLRYREIAEILGVSIKRVSELVQRALSHLAEEI